MQLEMNFVWGWMLCFVQYVLNSMESNEHTSYINFRDWHIIKFIKLRDWSEHSLFLFHYIYLNYLKGLEWETLITKASVVWPDSVLPLLSTIVPDTWST